MKKRFESEQVKKYTSQKGKYTKRAKRQKVKDWVSNNWIALLSLIFAIIALLK